METPAPSASIGSANDKPLGGLSFLADAKDTANTSVEESLRQEALLGPMEVAAYVGTQLTLMLGVWASAGVVMLTIMNSSHTREQYMFWFLMNLSVSTTISG